MPPSFVDDYRSLECRFRNLAEADDDVYLPSVAPHNRVDFIFVGMEPSLKRWAKCTQDAQRQVDSGVRNFLFFVENFIVHFCIRKYLCHEGQTYHLTNVSKGAMPVKKAKQNRAERYRRWYPLLKEEIKLVSKPNGRIFAIGKEVERLLTGNGCGRVEATLLHYSSQASRYREKLIREREPEFEQFAATVNLGSILRVAEEVLTESGMSDEICERTLSRVEKASLSESLKMLMFGYKIEFDKCA